MSAALIDSIAAEWRRCGGEKCHTRKCKRCARYRDWCQRNDKAAVR